MLLRRLARPLLASTFVVQGVDTLLHPDRQVRSATELISRGASDSLNAAVDPATLVRVTAAAQVAAGGLLALGRMPRIAATVLAATVVPATVTQQDFWAEQDPERRASKRTAFLKDLGLLGGLLIAGADTEGKPSLGWRGRRAARRSTEAVRAALPIGAVAGGEAGGALREHAHDTAIRTRLLADAAAAKGTELAGAAQTQGSRWAEYLKTHGTEWAEYVKTHGPEWADYVKTHGPEWAGAAREQGAEVAAVAREHGAEWADLARGHGAEWTDFAKDRGPDLAATAKERGSGLIGTVRDRAKAAHQG
ncbi:DoxX family protein [Nocardia thraciensis]